MFLVRSRRLLMRWMLLAASAVIAASLWLPGQAAEPAPPAAGDESISFEQYRDWRLHFIERRPDAAGDAALRRRSAGPPEGAARGGQGLLRLDGRAAGS